MRRRVFLIAGGGAAWGGGLLPTAGRAQAKPAGTAPVLDAGTAALITDLERRIPQLLAERQVPGAAIALIERGRLAWQRGFGVQDNQSKVPVNDATVFEAASVSKTVFAYAVMKLCERGVLGLDTPLSQYTPTRFLTGDPRLDFITARHALSHTTGFRDWRSNAAPLKIHFPPGTAFEYSGEGYYYLQSVVSQLAGRTDPRVTARYEAGLEVPATDIAAFLKRQLLAPFGMNASGYVWSDLVEKAVASPHDAAGRPLEKSHPSATDAARYASAGGLHTTAGDYARFLLEILDPKPADEFRLGPASLAEMLRPQVRLGAQQKIDGASAWALGWAIQERPTGHVIVHSGGQRGFRALTMASVGRQSGFILLTNGDNGGGIINDAAIAASLDRLFGA